jgi:hypothetical protein
VTDEESIRNFEISVTRASAINNAILIIGGDMNFPGWNWKENTLKPNSTAPNLHTDFMDVLNNNALTQLVEEPTRQQNTLDLILTNHPGKVIRTDTIPGISDYDIVYTEFHLRPVKKSVCRLGAVEFGFKVFSFQFHPGKFMSPPMINIALFIALALVTDVSKFLILSSSVRYRNMAR